MRTKKVLGLLFLFLWAMLAALVIFNRGDLKNTITQIKDAGKTFFSPTPPRVCIQPFAGIDTMYVQEVKKAIETYYGYQVTVLPEMPLPTIAKTTQIAALKYYNPSPLRYRADTLLYHLRKNIPASYDYILGLTALDISTTKRHHGKIKEPSWMYTDWSIFGLGFHPGKSCIVSTYRLGQDTYDQNKIKIRLRKIANHKLGHSLGLPHCSNKACFMRDLETTQAIDQEPEFLCKDCKRKINIP